MSEWLNFRMEVISPVRHQGKKNPPLPKWVIFSFFSKEIFALWLHKCIIFPLKTQNFFLIILPGKHKCSTEQAFCPSRNQWAGHVFINFCMEFTLVLWLVFSEAKHKYSINSIFMMLSKDMQNKPKTHTLNKKAVTHEAQAGSSTFKNLMFPLRLWVKSPILYPRHAQIPHRAGQHRTQQPLALLWQTFSFCELIVVATFRLESLKHS